MIFKIISLADSQKKSLYICDRDFHLTLCGLRGVYTCVRNFCL